jgi:hypothetical protein
MTSDVETDRQDRIDRPKAAQTCSQQTMPGMHRSPDAPKVLGVQGFRVFNMGEGTTETDGLGDTRDTG